MTSSAIAFEPHVLGSLVLKAMVEIVSSYGVGYYNNVKVVSASEKREVFSCLSAVIH